MASSTHASPFNFALFGESFLFPIPNFIFLLCSFLSIRSPSLYLLPSSFFFFFFLLLPFSSFFFFFSLFPFFFFFCLANLVSALRHLGPWMMSQLPRVLGAGIYYNTLIPCGPHVSKFEGPLCSIAAHNLSFLSLSVALGTLRECFFLQFHHLFSLFFSFFPPRR